MKRVAYSREFKLKFVREAMESPDSLETTSRKYNVAVSTGWYWFNKYRDGGEAAFIMIRNNRKSGVIKSSVHVPVNTVVEKKEEEHVRRSENYTPEFKLMVAMHAMIQDKTQSRIAYEFAISQGKVSEWKRELEEKGPQIFRKVSENPRDKPKSYTPKKEPFDLAMALIIVMMVITSVFIYVLISHHRCVSL